MGEFWTSLWLLLGNNRQIIKSLLFNSKYGLFTLRISTIENTNSMIFLRAKEGFIPYQTGYFLCLSEVWCFISEGTNRPASHASVNNNSTCTYKKGSISKRKHKIFLSNCSFTAGLSKKQDKNLVKRKTIRIVVVSHEGRFTWSCFAWS